MPTTFRNDLESEIGHMNARVQWLRNLHGLAVQSEQPTDVLASIHAALESTKDSCNWLHRAKEALRATESAGASC